MTFKVIPQLSFLHYAAIATYCKDHSVMFMAKNTYILQNYIQKKSEEIKLRLCLLSFLLIIYLHFLYITFQNFPLLTDIVLNFYYKQF